jgi:RNA polymerase sigma-70 factor (ECF subfamily)
MCLRPRDDPTQLLGDARKGHDESLGTLLELYRNYLSLLARTQIDLHLRGRASASDVVQDAFMAAHRDFGQFRGNTEAELLAWLRGILVHKVAGLVEKHALAAKRDVRRERRFNGGLAGLQQSAARIDALLVSQCSSPSTHLHRRERAAVLADLLAQLPSHYREVIVLRDLEGLGFAEVGIRMGRSTAAVRKLWVRAIDRLRQLLEREQLV